MSEEKPPRPTIPPPLLPEDCLLPPGKPTANSQPNHILPPFPGPCYELPQLLLPDPLPRLEVATTSRQAVLLERVAKAAVEVLQAEPKRKKAAPCYTPKKRILVDPEVESDQVRRKTHLDMLINMSWKTLKYPLLFSSVSGSE